MTLLESHYSKTTKIKKKRTPEMTQLRKEPILLTFLESNSNVLLSLMNVICCKLGLSTYKSWLMIIISKSFPSLSS